MKISVYFLLYLLYSFIGWICEVIYCYFSSHKFVNRGFYIGPICPIYGKGALLAILLLNRYSSEPLVLFVMSIVLCSIVEYGGSVFLEIIFKTRWWDYSNKKYNINGRICLETMIPFGLACMAITYVINQFFMKVINMIPTSIINILVIILLAILLVDIVLSYTIIRKFKVERKKSKGDNTEEVTEFVRNELSHKKKNKKLYQRALRAFPDFKSDKKN